MTNPQKCFLKAKPFFEEGNFNCAEISKKIDFTYGNVLASLSIYLNEYSQAKKERETLCPWCVREKSAVTDTLICGHVFHYF